VHTKFLRYYGGKREVDNIMRYPEFLQENGTIGFVAPSFGCATEPYYTAFHHALEKFQGMGYKTQLGPNCLVEKGIGISNEPELCGRELNESYCGSENDVIISCGGGELMCEVVPYIDFQQIAVAKPKWYMGFSDNTNFTFLSATLSDTAAVYGPCASSFGMEPWHASVQDAFDLLRGRLDHVHNYESWERESLKDEEHPLAPYNLTEPMKMRSFPQEEALMQGRLIGGCMDCLVNLLGTRFDKVKEFNERYREDGFIWFLESCDLNVMGIRRAIWSDEKCRMVFSCEGLFDRTSALLWGGDVWDRPVPGGDGSLGGVSGAGADGSGYRTFVAHDAHCVRRYGTGRGKGQFFRDEI